MNTTFVVTLDQPAATRAILTGGKGSRLASLHQQGFPVPDAFLVTAAAYEAWLASIPGLTDFTLSLDREESRNSLRDSLKAQPLPDAVISALREQLDDFPDMPVAVRSSSTLEDLAEAAFAGQHETFLNVRGAEKIIEKVRKCFISLWNERAISYRQQRGFDHRHATMAVVVQILVPCETAGVAFSLDPVSGDPGRILIDANHGLGESVVGGETPVDHWVMDRATLAVHEATIATKEHMTVSTDQGVCSQDLRGDEAALPCLDESALKQVAELVIAVERKARSPQDIEWGFAEGKLWLLQARAITTLPPRWTRDESAERFPNAITPLTWEFVDAGFHESLAWSLKLMGMPACQGQWFASFDHYIYGNQNLVEQYCGRTPFGLESLDDLEALVPRLREEFRWVQQLPVDWMRDLDSYLIGIGEALSKDFSKLDDLELWQHVQDLVRHGSDYFRPNIAISITHGLLCRVLHRLIGFVVPPEETAGLFQALLAWGNTKTSQINRELGELAALARQIPGVVELLAQTRSHDVWSGGQLASYPVFEFRFAKFIRDHGHRETDFDMYQPPWGDAPWVVIDHVKGLVRAPEPAIDAERQAKLASHAAEQRLFSKVPPEWQFFYSEILRLARLYTQVDDLEHYQTARLNLPLRRTIGALGERYRATGILDEAMDLFFASRAQINALVNATGSAEQERIADEIRVQKQAYQDACQREPAWILGDDSIAPGLDEAVLLGLPGSPGVAEGIIHHVRGPEDFAGFPTGAILVSRTTNPAWTPLFHLAAAVITESGGPLSHGAVTARELGIPAVMAVHRCLSQLPEGARVRVDGLRGRVSKLAAAG